ncbi:hypothetical protein RZS28_08000 [Methylocapsa polymorpha]|uniref:PepSY domain-containing protein n=1 Tax=Methylocapsa polymorpha TaxID=3080828 RepID=A0ABZ0HXB3_9HYPH|nr:hypothetical protein RZS28_08000 [Methylocapsa sp. RX1]
MRKDIATGGFALSLLVVSALAAHAETNEDKGAALAKALPQASVSLAQGLKASESAGTPISGKFEIDEDALQLSVYTMKGDKFSEIIVDQKSGAIKKTEAITDAEDLKDAAEQSAAVAQSKISLENAVQAAVAANAGYLAASAIPALTGEHPVADITLIKGEDVRKVQQKLD